MNPHVAGGGYTKPPAQNGVARPAPTATSVTGPGRRKRVDTIVLTPELWHSYERPAFQRDVVVSNAKLRAVAAEMAETGVFPGILTLGIFDKRLWRIDGQHRGEAFLVCGLESVIADVHFLECASMEEMALEYNRLNSQIVRSGPDDRLRAMEGNSKALRIIREACPFVGYSKRSSAGVVLSMAATLRCWTGSRPESPAAGGGSAADMAESLSIDSAMALTRFLKSAYTAWGNGDPQNARLWTALNLTIAMWTFRRVVLRRNETTDETRTAPFTLSDADFARCLQALTTSKRYLDYLVGRPLSDVHRSPCYDRMRTLMIARLKAEGIVFGNSKATGFPAPPWAFHNRRVEL